MTDLQKSNCEKLISYLLSDKLKAQFNMGQFCGCFECNSVNNNEVNKRIDCGTVGCAIGHGPYAGIPKRKEELWFSYMESYFGIAYSSPIGQWCFSASWSAVDNTPQGAALRLKWYLQNGLPDNCVGQLSGWVPLCYQEKLDEILTSKK